VSMRYSFDHPAAATTRKTQFFSMLGSRSIWHEGWKAVTTHPTLSGWSNFNEDEWELYHVDEDRAELNNLAAARANNAFPLDDRSAVEIFMTPRPQLTAPRDRYVYYPGSAPVPEWQSV